MSANEVFSATSPWDDSEFKLAVKYQWFPITASSEKQDEDGKKQKMRYTSDMIDKNGPMVSSTILCLVSSIVCLRILLR